jgi:hypothetical protein
MIMHHNALCTPYVMDHMKPKMEIQVQQVRLVLGGPQVSSCEDANTVVTKISPGASNHLT